MICPACGAFQVIDVLSREGVPVVLNRAWQDPRAARAVPRGRLQLVGCKRCDHVWNAAFEPEKLCYDADYENTQSHSEHFDGYLEDRVQALGQLVPKGGSVVEIGCGQGGLLKRLCDRFELKGTGFDPAFRGETEQGATTFVAEYYGPEHAAIQADLVLCRHVIEHLDDPVSMLKQVRGALASSPMAMVVFECPDLGWIVDNRVMWDFFYEHVQYFSASSLTAAFSRAGFQVIGRETVFAGQYQWLIARPSTASNGRAAWRGIVDKAAALADGLESYLFRLKTGVLELGSSGRVALWGAGAKGVTLAHLVDPGGEQLAGIIDVNPAKQGRFAGGTGLPILAPAAIDDHGITDLIVLNPNYLAEIIGQVNSHHPGVRVYLAASDGSLSCRHSSPYASPRSSAHPSSNAA